MGVNHLTLLGHVGGDPRVTTFNDGGKVAQFSVAYTEKAYTTKSGATVPEFTEWFNVVCKGSTAGVAEQYVRKGDKIYIEGKIKSRQYTAQDGTMRTITEVIVDGYGGKLELLGTPKQQAAEPQAAQIQYTQPMAAPQTAAPTAPPAGADDLPF